VVRKRLKRVIYRDRMSAIHHHHHEVMRKTAATRARVSTCRAPPQPLKHGARQSNVSEPMGQYAINEGLWVVNWDGVPPKHAYAPALRVESDNAGRLSQTTTEFRCTQRVSVRMPFHPPGQRYKFPLHLRTVRCLFELLQGR
jgi:hypothetical protein